MNLLSVARDLVLMCGLGGNAQATGDTAARGGGILPTILLMFGIVVFRLLYISFIWTAHPTLEVLYFCFPLSWAITNVLQFSFWHLCYKRLRAGL